MRPRYLTGLLIALVGVGLLAPGAGASLKKYRVQISYFSTGEGLSPNPEFSPSLAEPTSRAVIDASGASPVLKKLVIVSDTNGTTLVPNLGGFIYTSNYEEIGPTGAFTGTGSTETTIAWGLVTGWTISGTHWCNASPSFICTLADREYLESIDPALKSPFFDMGTWTFHGTGWTGTPWIHQTFDPGPGNQQYFLRGALAQDGSIPALTIAGLAVLSGSLVLAGLAALRRGKG